MVSANLANSDGCSPKPAKRIQRCAPFTGAKKKTASSNAALRGKCQVRELPRPAIIRDGNRRHRQQRHGRPEHLMVNGASRDHGDFSAARDSQPAANDQRGRDRGDRPRDLAPPCLHAVRSRGRPDSAGAGFARNAESGRQSQSNPLNRIYRWHRNSRGAQENCPSQCIASSQLMIAQENLTQNPWIFFPEKAPQTT